MRREGTGEQLWRVGLYIRLSKDDGHKESLSVQNQRKILLDYLAHEFQGEWVLEGEYIDDSAIIGLNRKLNLWGRFSPIFYIWGDS